MRYNEKTTCKPRNAETRHSILDAKNMVPRFNHLYVANAKVLPTVYLLPGPTPSALLVRVVDPPEEMSIALKHGTPQGRDP